jgi:hypothetical protein
MLSPFTAIEFITDLLNLQVMKKCMFSLLLCMFFSCALKAQQCTVPTSTTVTTPMSTVVRAWITCELKDDERASLDNEYLITHPGSEQIIPDGELYSSTNKFNCHGYAFVRSSGGSSVWIGLERDNDLDEYRKYLTDGSYIEVTQPEYPGILSWGVSHSATAIGQSGMIIEKIGVGPLLKHPISESVYSLQGVKYYKKSNGNSHVYVFSLSASSEFVCPCLS